MQKVSSVFIPGFLFAYNSFKQSKSVNSDSSSSTSGRTQSSFSSSNSSTSSSSSGRTYSNYSTSSNSSSSGRTYSSFSSSSDSSSRSSSSEASNSSNGSSSIEGVIGQISNTKQGMMNIWLIRSPILQRGGFKVFKKLTQNELKQLIKEKLMSSCTNQDLIKPNHNFKNQLIFGQGPINFKLWQNKLLTDKSFGVTASSSNVLALQRSVNVYLKGSNWVSGEQFQKFCPKLSHPCMYEVFIIPEKIKIGQYELPFQENQHILKNFEESIYQIQFDSKHAESCFQKLKDKFKGHDKNRTLFFESPTEAPISTTINIKQVSDFEGIHSSYYDHPYTYANQNNKQIIFQDNCIYIVNDINNLKDGDLKIHWNEIKTFQQASVIAEDSLTYLKTHIPDQLKGFEITLKVKNGDEFEYITLKGINLLKEGYVEKEVMIDEFLSQIEEIKKFDFNSETNFLTHALFLFLFYFYTLDELSFTTVQLTFGNFVYILLLNFGKIQQNTFIALLIAQFCILMIASPQKRAAIQEYLNRIIKPN